jgi:hypothetical protein
MSDSQRGAMEQPAIVDALGGIATTYAKLRPCSASTAEAQGANGG